MKLQPEHFRATVGFAPVLILTFLAAPAAAQQSRVFVTSTTSTGNLGGLQGADAICQTQGEKVDKNAEWIAWLSTSTVNAKDRLTRGSGPFVRASDGAIIANNIDDLIDGSLSRAIELDETGAPTDPAGPPGDPSASSGFGRLVWTGTLRDGTRAVYVDAIHTEGNYQCNDWTASEGSFAETGVRYSAVSGASNQSSRYWTHNSGSVNCALEGSLYCFERAKGPAITKDGRCFLEEFSGTGVGPNLEDPDGVYAATNGLLRKTTDAPPAGAGHRYVRTRQTNYRSTDWTYTVDFDSLAASWEDIIVGLGAAIRSKVNWVVDTPDQSVHLSINNHQPYGEPGRILLVVQQSGNTRPWSRVGNYSGAGGKLSVTVKKQGDSVRFFLENKGAVGRYEVASPPHQLAEVNLKTQAPWLTDANTRLFFGGRRNTLKWDSMMVSCP